MKNPQENQVLSVGHSNHDLGRFLELLEGAGVKVVADVRSQPFSKRLPHFNKNELRAALALRNIEYLFLGDVLGGRPDDDDAYDEGGRVDYVHVRSTDYFRRGLEQLRNRMKTGTVAMMCSEADPLDCHRGLMIAPALLEENINPGHLRRDGSVESTEEMEQRLLKATNREQLFEGLFAAQLTEDERRQELADAYIEMAQKKAFRVLDG